MPPDLRRITALALAIFTLAVASGALVATGAGAQVPPPTTGTTTAAPESQLAVLDANGGSVSGRTLTLTGVAPRAVWFSDRPERQAGTYRIPELLRTFFDDQAPPNAALEFAGRSARNDVAIVELSDPRWDAGAHRLRFTVQVLDDAGNELDPDTGLGRFVARNDARIPGSFDDVTVFLDDAPGGCPGTTMDGTTGSIEGLDRITCSDAQYVISLTSLTTGGFNLCTTTTGWVCEIPTTGGKPVAMHTPYTGGPLPQAFFLE
jgi:hypothetical protein